jgi:small subunit ribosomal protein S1
MSNSPEQFNWEDYEVKGFGEGYSRAKREELAKIYAETLNPITEREVVTGTVVVSTIAM